MALGTITEDGHVFSIELLASATAANGPPTTAGQGILVSTITDISRHRHFLFLLNSTAGSDTMSASVRLWGRENTAGVWMPYGTGTGGAKGVLNGGTSITESKTDKIRHSELLTDLIHFHRLYLEITAIAGTNTAVTGSLIWTIQDI